MGKASKVKKIERSDEIWQWFALTGESRREAIAKLLENFASFEPLFNAAQIMALPAGLAEDKIAKRLYETLRKGSIWLKDDFDKVATAIAAHGSHIGEDPEILWKNDGMSIYWDQAEGPAVQRMPGNGAVVLTKGWLYFTFSDVVLVLSPRSIPAPLTFVPGLVQGKLLLPVDQEQSAGFGIDPVGNVEAKAFFSLWPEAEAWSRSSFSDSGTQDAAFAFLPEEETFVCDGNDCGVINSTGESLAKRRAIVAHVFNQSGLDASIKFFGDPMVAWHSIVVKAAAESENKGSPVQVLPAHAQVALSLPGPIAKALIKNARDCGLLEQPRDLAYRWIDPSGYKAPQDLPFALEGFARLCPECYETLSSAK